MKDQVRYKHRLRHPERWWTMHRLSSHRNKYIVNVSVEELTNLALVTKKCPFCDCKLDYLVLGGLYRYGPSLDSINNENILNIDNVQILCYKCNVTKLNKTMKEFVFYYKMLVDKFGNN